MLQGLKASFRQPRVWGGGHRPDHRGLFLSPQIISQIWPYLSLIMENKVREKLEPKIREKSVHLRTFTFTKLDFGRKVSAASGRAAGPFLCPPPLSRLAERIPPDFARGRPPPALPSPWASI